jgi:hypothetical protein
MGKVPATLADLWVKGSQPTFTFDTTKKAGAGWNGPYVDISPAEFASVITQDGWGNSFYYSNASFTDTSFGATVMAKLASLGPDYTLGNTDDIAVHFFQPALLSRVQGFVKDTEGNVVSGVGMRLNYPVNGALSSLTTSTDASGFYSFADIPYGNRSITLQPQLVLAPGTTIVSGTADRDLSFTVRNYGTADINVASLTVAYSISPDSWFGQIVVGDTTVFDSTNPRFGNGDTVSFFPQTVTGTGTTEDSVQLRLQSPITDVGDVEVGKVGAGGSLAVQFKLFNDVESGGGGSNVDVNGLNLEVTFRNASSAVVGTVVVTP